MYSNKLLWCHYNWQNFEFTWANGSKSSDPYQISLNLRQIKNILNNDEYMDIDCFNMVVRILARNKVQLLRDIPSHYMDLNFCVSYYNHVSIFFLIALMFSYSYFRRCFTMHETQVIVKIWTLLYWNGCSIGGLRAMTIISHNVIW